jgi:DNA-binding transcriptional MerR regulator
MRLDEFVTTVNKRVAQGKIRPADPRARAKVTARTVQFYVAEGLIPSPTRQGNRLEFDDSHVEAVLEVKRQQAAGKTLEEIATTATPQPNIDFVIHQPRLSRLFDSQPLRSESVELKMRKFSTVESTYDFDAPQARFRWHIDLTNDIDISGSGPMPNNKTVDSIRRLLENHMNQTGD